MSDLITYLVSGVALGCTFALIGSGYVVIHRVTRVVNFAQGTFAVFGGFISYSLLDGTLPQGLAQLVTVVACGLIGLVVGLVAIGKPGTDPLIALIVTLGVSIFCAAVFITAWGQDPISPPGLTGSVSILGADVQRQRLLVVAATLLTFVALSLFFSRTYAGKGLTACASNPRAAALVGINVRRMGFMAFAVGGALGGLAGALISPSVALSFSSDLPFALSGFAAAVFGGLTSPGRTLLGGIVLGVTGQLVAGYLDGSFQTEVALLMMLAIMVVRSRTFVTEEAK
ncbi:branched-chain amino acid ABC transporter permease [Terrabacter sp. GCM10028922]|uniref:branched-chain amino acid ABC transporter permease n=1 Tax=Terrabacter sp. GCM10028922 TaxID=3273428 RepID=UPI00362130B4